MEERKQSTQTMLYPMTGLPTARITSMLDKASSITHNAHMLRGAHMHTPHTCTHMYGSGRMLAEGSICVKARYQYRVLPQLLSPCLWTWNSWIWLDESVRKLPESHPLPLTPKLSPALGSQTQTKTPGFFLWVLRMQTHVFITECQALAQISHLPSPHNTYTLGRLKVAQNFRKYRKL